MVVLGVIYKVSSSASNRVYIGSTGSEDIKKRLRSHERAWRSWRAGKYPSCAVFKIFEDGDYKIEALETVTSTDGITLREREAYYYRLFGDAVVNARNPHQTKAERKEQQHNAHRKRYSDPDVRKARLEYQAMVVRCEVCNEDGRLGQRARHNKSLKHLANLKKAGI